MPWDDDKNYRYYLPKLYKHITSRRTIFENVIKIGSELQTFREPDWICQKVLKHITPAKTKPAKNIGK